MLTSRPITFTVGAALTPSWLTTATANSYALGKWLTLTGASPSHGLSATASARTIDSVKPTGLPAILGTDGNDAVTKAWGGGALVRSYGTRGGLGIWNGGHKNYYGNEFYMLDLESRMWIRITDPYPTPDFPVTDGWHPANGLQVNGSPSVPHTYALVQYDPIRNSFFTFRTMVDNTPNNIPQFGELMFGTNVWQKREKATFGIGSGGWSVYDSTRRRYVIRGGSGNTVSPRTIVYDPASSTPLTYFNPTGLANLVQTYTVGAYDPVADVIVIVQGDTGALYGLDPANLGTAPVLLTEANAPTKPNQGGWAYSPNRGAFIFYSSGANVYECKKGAGDWRTATWTWTNLLSGSNTVTPEDMEANGVFSKFQIASYGSTDLAFVVKRTGATGTGAAYSFWLN